MEYIFIYLLQISHIIAIIKDIFFILLCIGIIGFTILGIFTGFQYENHKKEYYDQMTQDVAKATTKFFKNIIITSSILFSITALIPSKQTLLLIGGTYLGKKTINAVVTDKKIEKINTIIELELDKRIEELQLNKSKS